MSTLRISDAPLLPDVDGTEKIPTGGRGDYAISVDQIKDHIFQDVGKELVGLGNVDNTSDLNKPVSTAQQAALDLKADKTYVDSNLDLKADKINVYTRSETTLALSAKADLVNGVVPENQIPSSFNDVLEFTTPNLPIIGESGKIYVTTDNNKTWRWGGNKYVEVSNGGVSDSTLKLQTPRKIANVDFDGTQNIDIPHNNLTNRNALNAHTAVSIGTASGENQQDINDYNGAKWRNKAGGYDLSARVMLDNGDVVKSIIAGNTNNPNEDMTGWYNPDQLQRMLNFEQVSFTTLGIIPNTGTDLTLKINQSLITHRNLFIPDGDYLITSINIQSNTVITTQGRGVRFIQKAASGEGTRVVKVVGSNVYLLPAISVKGNIATDPNEQNHAIYIQANATTGSINNVNIGDVYAEDIRGDAVYFGQATGAQYKLTNVTIGNVSFDNVYRNGVSVVSCNGFNIKSVVGKRVGMMDIDIEANIGSGVCVNGYIGFVKGKCIGGIAQTQTDFVDNVIFDRVELSYTNYINSTPEYPSYYKIPVLYRNIKSMTINELIIDGCDGYAISRIDGDAPLANTPLRVGKLTLKNACKVSNAENGIIKGGHVIIDYLDMDFSGLADRSLFYAGSNYVVNKADVNFATNCSLFRSVTNPKISKLTTKSTGLGRIFNGGSNGSIEDSTANIERIFSNATKGLMINCNFTAVTPFSGGDNHTAINTDINGSYYANGLTQYGYLNCLRMGVFHLWVAADGKLRIKSGVPTSDTDGTIVGTQV